MPAPRNGVLMAKWEPKAHEREVRKERKISRGTFMLGSMLAVP